VPSQWLLLSHVTLIMLLFNNNNNNNNNGTIIQSCQWLHFSTQYSLWNILHGFHVHSAAKSYFRNPPSAHDVCKPPVIGLLQRPSTHRTQGTDSSRRTGTSQTSTTDPRAVRNIRHTIAVLPSHKPHRLTSGTHGTGLPVDRQIVWGQNNFNISPHWRHMTFKNLSLSLLQAVDPSGKGSATRILLLHSAWCSASSTLSCKSSMLYLTTLIHLFLCLPLLRCPLTFASKIRLTQSSSSRRCTCPYHLSLASPYLIRDTRYSKDMQRMSSFLFLSLKVRPRIHRNIVSSVRLKFRILTIML